MVTFDPNVIITITITIIIILIIYKTTSSFAKKKSRCDFDDKLKVGDVRYKHLTQITIKVQLFDVYHMKCNSTQIWTVYE